MTTSKAKCPPTTLKPFTVIIIHGKPGNNSSASRAITSTTCSSGYFNDHDNLNDAKCAAEAYISSYNLMTKPNLEVWILDRRTGTIASFARIPQRTLLDWTDSSSSPEPETAPESEQPVTSE